MFKLTLIRHGLPRTLPTGALVVLTFLCVGAFPTQAHANESVWSCGLTDATGANNIWVANPIHGIDTVDGCGSGTGLQIDAIGDQVQKGQSANWEATAPAGLIIVLVYVPPNDLSANAVNDGDSFYGGGFFWDGGGAQISDGNNSTGFGASGLYTSHVGFQLICGVEPCPANNAFGTADLAVKDIGLQVAETQTPWLSSSVGIWASSGWIRGSWPLSFTGDSPSGICDLTADIDGIPVVAKSFPENDTTWHQCNAIGLGGASQPIDTANLSDGSRVLSINGVDAAGATVTDSKVLMVDNSTPSASLTGPTDALSTAGTQQISVTGDAGPSGVSGVGCSVDGSPVTWTSAPTTTVPVSGIGPHVITCYAANNARDSSGNLAVSPPATWNLSIRQPSVSTVSFAHVVDALQCRRTREKVTIPARWVTARSNGQPVRVKLPAQTRKVTVVHCRPRFVRKRVRVDGHSYTERVIVLPHRVMRNRRKVRYGATTTVSGWLGTAAGNAIAGQAVEILTAPADGRDQFTPAGDAVTAANGSWTAVLPAGPSRLVRVAYAGSATVEPALSNTARLVVPALVKLRIHPSITRWGSTIKLDGRLAGGHIPPAGELVVLRIGWAGGTAEIGHIYANRRGVFRSSYTFLRGNGTETYRIWAQTARESDYPYAVGTSRRVRVRVGS